MNNIVRLLLTAVFLIPIYGISKNMSLIKDPKTGFFIVTEDTSQPVVPVSQSNFVVLDMTPYLNKPIFNDVNFKTAADMWQGHFVASPYPANGYPRSIAEIETRTLGNYNLDSDNVVIPNYNQPIFIDVECYGVNTAWNSVSQINENLNKKYKPIIEAARSGLSGVSPTQKIGFYGRIPRFEGWGGLTIGSTDYLRWQADNDRNAAVLMPLVDHMGLLGYQYWDDGTILQQEARWQDFITKTINEAVRIRNEAGYTATQRPIYVYIWNEYHEGAGEPYNRPLDTNYFVRQMQYLKDNGNVDGVLIWSNDLGVSWNDKAEWWVKTKTFINSLK